MPQKEIKSSTLFLKGLFAVVIVAVTVGIFLTLKLIDQNRGLLEEPTPEESAADQFFERLEQRQKELLKSSEFPQVSKEDRQLTVRFQNGDPKFFTDCLDCGPEKDIEHFFVERFADPAAVLIYRQFYEGDDQVLVTGDGNVFELPSYPIFSPDKKSFVVVSAAEAFNWNGVEVWDKDSKAGFVRKLHHEPKQADLYRFLSWDGNDLVKLEYSTYEAGPDSKAICQGAELVREKNEWKLRDVKNQVRAEFCPYTEDWIPEALRRFGGPAPVE
jgi:hypothetical protein